MLLAAEYWIDKADRPDKILRSPEDIEAFNRNTFVSDPNMVPIRFVR